MLSKAQKASNIRAEANRARFEQWLAMHTIILESQETSNSRNRNSKSLTGFFAGTGCMLKLSLYNQECRQSVALVAILKVSSTFELSFVSNQGDETP